MYQYDSRGSYIAQYIKDFCTKDIGSYTSHLEMFNFIEEEELQKRIAMEFYIARYIAKLQIALKLTTGSFELFGFLKMQLVQYGGIFEAIITYLLKEKYIENDAVKSICKKTEYKIAHIFPSGISVKQGDAELFLCSKKESETDKLEYIKLEDKLKAAVKIGLISDEIKIAVLDTYELRSSVHIQTAVKKTIEFEIKHCRDAFYTLIDFLKQIRTFLNYSETPELKEEEERITSEFEENLAAVRQDNIDNQIGYIPGII